METIAREHGQVFMTQSKTRRTPTKTREKTPRKKLTYLKGYRELVPDPWGLES